MDFKLSTLVIVITVFIAAMATGASWVTGIQANYPSANLSAEWNDTFYQMEEIDSIREQSREDFSGSQAEGGQETGESSDVGLIAGTVTALSNAKASIALIPTFVSDFMNFSDIQIPIWFYSTILTIIIVSILFTLAGAFLRRNP